MRRRFPIAGAILAATLLGVAVLPGGVWAAGRAPAVPARMVATPADAWNARWTEGKQLFQQRDFRSASAVFASLQPQRPNDPWLELYLRVSRLRLQQLQAPPVESLPTPAILRVMGMPPVVIRPTERPLLTPPPASPAASPAPLSTPTAPAGVSATPPPATTTTKLSVTPAAPPLCRPGTPWYRAPEAGSAADPSHRWSHIRRALRWCVARS